MSRVDYEELEPSDDYLIMLHDGNPFSGVAFERMQDGNLISETTFVEGQKSGISKEWSSSGTLIREQFFLFYAHHGRSCEWYESGAPKIDGLYELGVCIHEKAWDESGNEIKSYVIDETSAQFATLEKLRVSHLGGSVKQSNV